MFLNNGSVIRRLASLHWLQLGAVRHLRRYYQDALTSCRSSHRASLPSLGGTSGPLVVFAPRRTSAPPGPGVGNPVSPAGILPRKRQDLPSSWGTSIIRLHMFLPTPAGLLAPDHYGAATWPLVCEQQRLPRKVFRRSIAWLSDSLSTLRTRVTPTQRKTRFQPLVRRYWTGFHPQGSFERFQSCFLTSHSPFPSFLAQSHRPEALWSSRFRSTLVSTWPCDRSVAGVGGLPTRDDIRSGGCWAAPGL